MILTKEQFEELCAAYAIGALEADGEVVLFNALEEGGEEFRKIFTESMGVSYLLNQSVTHHTPSPLVKRNLIKKIFKGPKQSYSFSQFFDKIALSLGFGNPRFGFIVSLLLVIVAAEIAFFAYVTVEEVSHRDEQLALYQSTSMQLQQLLALQNENERLKEILTVLQSPTIEIVTMNGQEINPSGHGKIIWDPARNIAILQVSKLPAVSSNNDYQLWYFNKEKTPISAGVFSLSAEEQNYFRVSEIPLPPKEEISAFAVTLEPKGGVTRPTGSMYLFGAL